MMMLQPKNFDIASVYALYNKGVSRLVATHDSLTYQSEKKIVNYLVVPNNFILSLSVSLSLSLSSRAGSIYFYFIFVRARGLPCIPLANKGVLEISFVLFLCLYTKRNFRK